MSAPSLTDAAVTSQANRQPLGVALNIVLLWIGFFAGWTAISVPLTLTGAPFSALWGAFAAGLVGAAILFRSRTWLAPVLLSPGEEPPLLDPGFYRPRFWESVGLAAMAAATLYFIPSEDARPLWAVTLLLAALVVLRPVPAPAGTPQPARTEAAGYGALIAIAVVILAYYFLVLRPDADDAFYLDLPIGLKNSGQGMMVWDTMYGVDGWPFMLSSYRVESLPTLVAAVSWATGLPVVVAHHVILPTIWCIVLAATLAVIGHGLFGARWWVFAVIAILTPLVIAGGSLPSWGAHGIPRMFHGKAPLMLIVLPLIVFIVIKTDAARLGIGKSLVPLIALELAALGLTANSIYLAPLTLGLSIAAGWLTRGGRGIDRLLLLAAAIPPLVAGVWLLIFDKPAGGNMGLDGIYEGTTYIDLALWRMANGKLSLAVIVGVAVAALAAYRAGPRGRWPAAFLLAALIFVINPFLLPHYDTYVTGGLSQRVYWAMPAQMIIAVALTWLVLGTGRIVAATGAVAIVLAVFAFSPTGLFAMKGTSFDPSLTKRPEGMAERIAAIRELSTPDRLVLAPEPIAEWVPTFEGEDIPMVFVRMIYLPFLSPHIPTEQFEARRDLLLWMWGRASPPPEEILADLSTVCPGILVLDPSAPDIRDTEVMTQIGAEQVGQVDDMLIYSIEPPGC